MSDPVGAPPEGVEEARGADGDWQRMHPLSPLLRGGVVLIAILGYALSQIGDRILSGWGLGWVTGSDPDDSGEAGEALVSHPFIALGLGVLLLAVVGLVSWVAWRFTRFRVAPHQVELRSGVLFRQHRQVPFERVQAVELSRPILARLLGLAQVVVQSAGGSDSQLTLAFLPLARAEDLRDELLVLAGHSDEDDHHAADVAPGSDPVRPAAAGPVAAAPAGRDGRPVLAVPNGRLFVATILHGSTIVLGALAVVALLGAGIERFGAVTLVSLPALVPAAFAIGMNRVKELLVHGNFRVADTGTGVRVQEGLTDLRTTTIPIHRVQAVELMQPLWWRPFGWWRIRVNVAGVGSGGEGEGQKETVVLPVGTFPEAVAVLDVVAPQVTPDGWFSGAHGEDHEPGWNPVSTRTRRLDPFTWRRNAWRLEAAAVLLRSGRWSRSAVAVPHARIQSVTLRQGWLEARLGVASVHVVPAPGPVSPDLAHLDLADAEGFLAQVGARARDARRRRRDIGGSLADDPSGLVNLTHPPQEPLENERQ
ncbi:PH domain-containing protein [Oryzobacter terrae]|uniref:PH domain-containing protein n=1 Tax=Oryzobacter terrae TaxID=1620385 RepID=UPI003670B8CE